jgi:hypothetical protein
MHDYQDIENIDEFYNYARNTWIDDDDVLFEF